MKKRLFAFILIFILLLGAMPAAMADYTYLNTSVAGERIDMILEKNEFASVACTAGAVPSGCVVETELKDGMYHHYLRGTPMYAGNYSFTLAFSSDGTNPGKTVTYSCLIVAATPNVVMPENISCYQGDDVKIELRASVNDYGTLSYQWYSNTYNLNRDGTLIKDEVQNSYKPDTSKIGTTYYYCEVTNTNNGQSSVVTTSTVSVTVDEAAVSYITVSTMPKRTEYTVGDWLDATGMKLRVVYTNGKTEELEGGFGLYPTELRDEGSIDITVDYKGKECTFSVTVKADEKKIENMSIISKPAKLEYVVGDTLDTTGLKLRVSYAGGRIEDVSEGFTCSPTTFNKEGTQAITVTFGGKSTSFTVKVKAKEEVKSISVSTPPAKLQYKVGEKLDTTGMKLSVDTGSEKKEISTGFSCSPNAFNKAGEYEIKVSYGGKETSFKISVTEDVTQSPELSEKPSETPVPSGNTQAPAAKKSNVLLVAGIIAAVLALAALGAYVYIMSRGNTGRRRRR